MQIYPRLSQFMVLCLFLLQLSIVTAESIPNATITRDFLYCDETKRVMLSRNLNCDFRNKE